MRRDFTYIDDVVEAVVRLIDRPPAPDPGLVGRRSPTRRPAPRRGASTTSATTSPVEVLHVVALLEQALGRKAVKRELLPMQPGDVPETYADVDDLMRDIGFRPATPIEEGDRRVRRLVSRRYESRSGSV